MFYRSKLKMAICLSVVAVCCAFLFGVYASFATVENNKNEPEIFTTESLFKNKNDSVIEGVSDLPDWFGIDQSGVVFNHRAEWGGVMTSHPIDVTTLSATKELVSLWVVPQKKGEANFSEYYIRVSDYYNENNFFEVKINRFLDNAQYCYYMSVRTQDVDFKATRGGTTQSPVVQNCFLYEGLFAGVNLNGSVLAKPFALSYDAITKRVYYYNELDNSLFLLRDLSSSEHMGKGFEWKGFSGKLVNVSFSSFGNNSTNVRVMLTKFAGMNLGKDFAGDTEKPSLHTSADNDPSLFKGCVGREYKLYSCEAYDVADGDLTDKTEISVTDDNGADVPVTAGKIIPETTGVYTVKYSVKDRAGNVAEKVYSLNVYDVPPEIGLNVDEGAVKTEAVVGETLTIPVAATTGGVGQIQVKTYVENFSNGQKTEIVNGLYKPLYTGNFEIVYYATDYIGSHKTLRVGFIVNRGNKPIGTFPELPRHLVAGKAYKFPVLNAYDYVTDVSGGVKADVRIQAFYKSDESDAVDIQDYKFTPVLASGVSSDVLHVKYTASLNGNAVGYESISQTYDINVVAIEKASDLLISDNGKILPSAVKKSNNFVEYDVDGNGTLRYINPLAVLGMELKFSVPSEISAPDKSNTLQSVEWKLTDAKDSGKCVTFTISPLPENGKSKFSFGGNDYKIAGAFFDTEFSFTYNSDDNTVKAGDIVIAAIEYFDNGEAFNGFPSSTVYSDICLSASHIGAFRLMRVGSQPIFSNINSSGTELAFADKTKPIIVINGEVPTIAKLHDKIVLPTARAYDSVDPYVECRITISYKSRGGSWVDLIYATLIEDEELFFNVEQTGDYRISYRAKDSSNRSVDISAKLVVRDCEPPVIFVSGKVPGELKAGNSVVLPKAVAFDDASDTAVKVFVLYNGVINEIKADDKGNVNFRPDKSGKYIIRYYAYDLDYNVAYRDYVVKVS